MIYSIQNSSGEVYGTFEMPRSNQSAEVWAAELGDELKDILGINGVNDRPLVTDAATDTTTDRIIIDIDPVPGDESARLERVHETISRLALRHTDA